MSRPSVSADGSSAQQFGEGLEIKEIVLENKEEDSSGSSDDKVVEEESSTQPAESESQASPPADREPEPEDTQPTKLYRESALRFC